MPRTRLLNARAFPGPVLASLLTAVLLHACTAPGQTGPENKPPAPVHVGSVLSRTVPVQIAAIGNVEAYSSVGVRAQVGGVLTRVHFREGQDVSKGSLLFTIDPKPYETLVKQAEANLARDRAQMENAVKDTRRYEELFKKGYVAREQYEQFSTNAAALEATVEAARAILESARLQLKYCYIYSPITGRTGNLLADEGNLIKANADTPMVTINRIQPVHATFSVPEQNLAEIKKYMARGRLQVEAYLSGEDKTPEQGELMFIDNAVDSATGTIKLKGTFPNAKRRLWPGQFVNIRLTLTTRPEALLVPSRAVQTGQDGRYVFVVGKDNTVESRPVVAALTIGDETIIENGLRPGETVVTDGQLRLVPGAKVEIKNRQ